MRRKQGDYDLVVIGSPTWWLTTNMPIRSYLKSSAAESVLDGKPFAAFSVSRRYWKGNMKDVRKLGEDSGGRWVGRNALHLRRRTGHIDALVARVHEAGRTARADPRREDARAQPEARLRGSRRAASSSASPTARPAETACTAGTSR